MLGFSFGEIMVISLVALVAVGPQKLPGMLKTMGQWVRKLRQMTMDVRQQTGIDEMLRAEGIQLSELRSLMRGYHAPVAPAPAATPTPAATPAPTPRYDDPYGELEPDPTREYPLEGADAYGALPDDLLEPTPQAEAAAAPGPPVAVVEPPAVAAEEPSPALVVEATVVGSVVEPSVVEPSVAEPPVVSAPVAASSPKSVGTPSAPELEPEPLSEPKPKSAPPSAPRRSVPPPPPSRSGIPRPASSAPPPPPRRSSGPPRPEPTGAVPSKPEAAPVAVPRPGNANGNG